VGDLILNNTNMVAILHWVETALAAMAMAEMAAMDTAGAMVRPQLQTERLCMPFQPALLSALAALEALAEQAGSGGIGYGGQGIGGNAVGVVPTVRAAPH